MKKIKGLILLLVLIAGINTSYADDVRIKKIRYAMNVYYEGEAVKNDKEWQPKGAGTLHILYPNSLKIEGNFDGSIVSGANMVMLSENPHSVFRGELTFEILPNSTNKLYKDIRLSFLSGDINFSNGCKMSVSSPLDYLINENGEYVETNADMTSNKDLDSQISRHILFHGADPLYQHNGRDYIAKCKGSMFMENNGLYFRCHEISQVTWGNGTFVLFNGDTTKTIYSEKAVFVYYKKSELFQFMYKLSDSTIVNGYIEKMYVRDAELDMKLIGKPFYISKIKCADGRVLDNSEGMNFNDFYATTTNGATIKGVKTIQELFANISSLTKNDITIQYGCLYDKDGNVIDYFGDGEGRYGEFPFF